MKSKIVPIASDASSRKFYRLVGKNKSKIIVFSEEEKYRNLIAYVAINNFLRKNKIFAPKLYEHNFTKAAMKPTCEWNCEAAGAWKARRV